MKLENFAFVNSLRNIFGDSHSSAAPLFFILPMIKLKTVLKAPVLGLEKSESARRGVGGEGGDERASGPAR